MSEELLKKAAAKSIRQDVPSFQVGDTVNVSVRIVEGEKERIQVFRGTVIGRGGRGVSQTFRVRRIVNNQGVERTFPLHSPNLVGVEVVRSGKTRRAKLHFLRKRVGRATRLRDVAPKAAAGRAKASADEPEPPAEQATQEDPKQEE